MSDIHMETVLPVSPQTAYSLFSHPNLLEQWLCNTAHLEVRTGGSYYISCSDGWWAVGKYTAVELNQHLALTWLSDGAPSATHVAVTFTPEADGTRLTLHHTSDESSGWTDEMWAALQEGWTTNLADLAYFIETGLDARFMRRPMMGINFEPLTPELITKLHSPVSKGLGLSGVVEGSGASNAGLKANDIIVGMDGTPIAHFSDLTVVIQQHSAGDTIPVEFYRGQDKHTVQMTFGQRPTPKLAESQAALTTLMREAVNAVCAELDAAVDGASEAEMSVNPAAGEWSANQTLAHCIWTERWSAFNIWGLAGGDGHVPWVGNQANQIAGILATQPTGAALVAELKRALNELPPMIEALDPSMVSNPALFKQIAMLNSDVGGHVREHLAQIKSAIASARQPVPA